MELSKYELKLIYTCLCTDKMKCYEFVDETEHVGMNLLNNLSQRIDDIDIIQDKIRMELKLREE